MNDTINRNTFKFLSILLDYPSKDWPSINEYQTEISQITNTEVIGYVNDFLNYTHNHRYNELTENYVSTFDFNQDTNLYLANYRIKDERQRTSFLVKLKSFYRSAGLILEKNELPDYLPLILEFISIAPEDAGIIILNEHMDSIKQLHQSLMKKENPYARLLEACLVLANCYIKDSLLKQKQA